MLNRLKSIFSSLPSAPAEGQGLAAVSRQAAGRFSRWASQQVGRAVPEDGPAGLEAADEALNALISTQAEPGGAAAADAAAFLGEAARVRWPEAQWQDHPLYGPIVTGIGGLDHGKLLPEALVVAKWREKEKFRLPGFFASLEKRCAEEGRLFPMKAPTPGEILEVVCGTAGTGAQQAALQQAEAFRARWKERHRGMELPLSLIGVRQLDAFLRSHYAANFLPDGALVQAGFYVGEVARGLFEGQWDLEAPSTIDRAALCWPELAYYPVGRVYKMMTSWPEGDPLDEYVRLVPAARKELRGR